MKYHLVNIVTHEIMGGAALHPDVAAEENRKLREHNVELQWQEQDCTICNNTGRFDDGDRWVPCPCGG